jgi:hypothetical protein
MWISAAAAQSPPETPSQIPAIPEKIAPAAPTSADNLSEKLKKSDGMIIPPPTGDAMQVPTPPSGDSTMPVIPPPATPGGGVGTPK